MAAGLACKINVQVRNVSTADWQVPLCVGNHWRDPDGTVVTFDDGRAVVPSLKKGDVVEIALPVSAPAQPGRYQLEVDVVQEGIRWFADVGSATASVSISVETGAREEFGAHLPQAITANIDPVYVPAPPFEMHGVLRRRVEEIASASGMRLLQCDDHHSEWVSHGYYFEKRHDRVR
ncbi:MAG: hypothetical protein U1E60_04905 [Reyranellaceae bacterium]